MLVLAILPVNYDIIALDNSLSFSRLTATTLDRGTCETGKEIFNAKLSAARGLDGRDGAGRRRDSLGVLWERGADEQYCLGADRLSRADGHDARGKGGGAMSAVLPASAMRRVTCRELRLLGAAYRLPLAYAAARCARETNV